MVSYTYILYLVDIFTHLQTPLLTLILRFWRHFFQIHYYVFRVDGAVR